MLIYLGFTLVAVGAWLASEDITILSGTLFGGGLSLVNFNLLKLIGRKIVEDPKNLKVQYFALAWFKVMALIALCFMTVVYWDAYFNVGAFFISLGVIIAAVIVATVYAVYQGFTDLVDEEWQKTEEKFVGWDDVDNPHEKDYKAGSKKSFFDEL